MAKSLLFALGVAALGAWMSGGSWSRFSRTALLPSLAMPTITLAIWGWVSLVSLAYVILLAVHWLSQLLGLNL